MEVEIKFVDEASVYDDMKICVRKIDHCAVQMVSSILLSIVWAVYMYNLIIEFNECNDCLYQLN